MIKIHFEFLTVGFMDIQYLSGSRSNHATIVYGIKNRGSRDYNFSLFVCSRLIQSAIYIELDLPLLY